MRLSLNCAQAPMRVPAYDKLQLALRAPFPLKDALPYHYRNQSLAHNIKAQAGIPAGEIAGIENCSIEYCVAENCTGQIADFFKQWDESSWSLVTDTNSAINTVHGSGALPLQHERGNGSSTPAVGQNTATGSDINITYFERENA